MKKTKTILLLCTAVLFSFSFVFFSGCEKDKCKDTYCLNGGDCHDGSCKCPAGYYGEHCEKDGSGNNGGSGGGSYGDGTGDVIFWLNDDYGCGSVTVTVNGRSGTISKYRTSGVPDCGDPGYANFNLNEGSYQYTASCSGGLQWSGNITIREGVCLTMLLSSNGGSGNGGGNNGGGNNGGGNNGGGNNGGGNNGGGNNGGGNNGGGNNGGGNTQSGEVMFWTETDHQCGPITVTCNGRQKVITNYYYNGAPNCNASGCATFTLPTGRYSFSASCQGGRTWSGTVDVSIGRCSTMNLR